MTRLKKPKLKVDAQPIDSISQTIPESTVEIIGDTSTETPVSNQQLSAEIYFPTVAYSIDKPEFLPQVKAASESALTMLKIANPKVNDIYPLYQTPNLLGDMRIQEFAQYIADTGWNILQSQGYDMTNLRTTITELWCQEHYKHSGMDEHVHGFGAQIVGFYFLETPEDCSKIVMHDPRPSKKQINLPEANMFNATAASLAVNFTPRPGMLFFANSWVPHSFSRHAGEKPIKFIHFTLGVQAAEPAVSAPMPSAEIV
jgi:hypothetical protein